MYTVCTNKVYENMNIGLDYKCLKKEVLKYLLLNSQMHFKQVKRPVLETYS